MPITNVIAGEPFKASKVNEIINNINAVADSTTVTFGGGSNPIYIDNDSISTTNSGYTLVRSLLVGLSGTVTVSFRLIVGDSGGSSTAYGRIYRNGVAVGTERSLTGSNTSATYSENISLSKGDYLQLYIRTSQQTFTTASAENFKVLTNATPSFQPYFGKIA